MRLHYSFNGRKLRNGGNAWGTLRDLCSFVQCSMVVGLTSCFFALVFCVRAYLQKAWLKSAICHVVKCHVWNRISLLFMSILGVTRGEEWHPAAEGARCTLFNQPRWKCGTSCWGYGRGQGAKAAEIKGNQVCFTETWNLLPIVPQRSAHGLVFIEISPFGGRKWGGSGRRRGLGGRAEVGLGDGLWGAREGGLGGEWGCVRGKTLAKTWGRLVVACILGVGH